MLFKYQSVYPNLGRWVDKHLDGNWTELSRRAGINYGTLHRIATGARNPRKDSIDKILRATGLSYEEAFYEDD
jgi:predicted transcriptional regulator